MKASQGKGFGQGKGVAGRLSAPRGLRVKKSGMGLRIVALTERGDAALRRHRVERLRAPLRERLLFKSLYDETVESESPYTIRLAHKQAHVAALVPFESMCVPIVKALGDNGAVRGIDYEVEVL